MNINIYSRRYINKPTGFQVPAFRVKVLTTGGTGDTGEDTVRMAGRLKEKEKDGPMTAL
jgi:hypothetical protein